MVEVAEAGVCGPGNKQEVKPREAAGKGSPGFGVRAEGERASSGTHMVQAESRGE